MRASGMIAPVTRDDTSAAILAGGRARRLGGLDKSRLVVSGQPIIVRQLAVLQPIAREVFVVAPDTSRFVDLNVRVCPDVVAGAGAIGGILTAVECADAPFVIVIACDLPFLTTELLARLAELAETADASWTVRARGAEPLVACYRKSTAAAIRSAIDLGRLKAAELD